MKVFITWSGQLSLTVAQKLHDWLPSVIQALRPFVSSEEIRSGQRWADVVASELETTSFGIVWLTRENKVSHPWIHFEAGAIAKSVKEGRVTSFLIDLEISEIPPPLSQFQAVPANDAVRVEKLVRDLNELSGSTVTSERLKKQFQAYWPELYSGIAAAIDQFGNAELVGKPKTRTEQALENILLSLNDLSGRIDRVMARESADEALLRYFEAPLHERTMRQAIAISRAKRQRSDRERETKVASQKAGTHGSVVDSDSSQAAISDFTPYRADDLGTEDP